jgi:hypothetical protein
MLQLAIYRKRLPEPVRLRSVANGCEARRLAFMAQPTESSEHPHLSSVEARQGMMLGRMRYVLAISTALAVVALFSIMVFFR